MVHTFVFPCLPNSTSDFIYYFSFVHGWWLWSNIVVIGVFCECYGGVLKCTIEESLNMLGFVSDRQMTHMIMIMNGQGRIPCSVLRANIETSINLH